MLLLALCLTSIAYAQTALDSGQAEIGIEAAPASAAPAATFFGKAIGGVTPGDLFYINATNSPQDMTISLYITNADELIHYFRYLIFKVAVYVEDIDGQWKQITSQDGISLPDTYITLQNSPVNFILPGLGHYKVTIDSGCYNCFSTPSDGSNMAPSFYLNVEAT
jgi:hypothetical protein